MRKYFIIFLLLLFVVYSCNKFSDDYKDTDIKVSVDDSSVDKIKIDTLVLSQPPKVIFFMPSSKEQRRLMNIYASSEQWEFIQLFNDFYSFYSKASSALKRFNIPSQLTYSTVFKIYLPSGMQTLVLKKEHQIMGFILYDSTHYKINYGIYNNKDFIKEIRDFYGIKFHF